MNRPPLAPLLALLSGTLLLGLLFLSTVPPGYGPDEVSHFRYVRALAEGKGFPVLGPSADPQGPTYEAHQPPLYYLLSVPPYLIGRGVAGEGGAWVAVRLFTLACGLGTVVLVYLLALRLFPGEPWVAAGAGAFAGWLPSQAALFSVVNNDPLTELGFTLCLYLLARHLMGPERGKWDSFRIGLVAGLTFLTKSSGLILFLVAPLGLLMATRKEDSPRLRPWLFFALGAVVAVPWMLRNVSLYGDPLGWRTFVNYFLTVRQSPTPYSLAERTGAGYSFAWYWLGMVGAWAFRDSLGMWLFSRPGQPLPMRVGLPPPAYALWGLLWLAALIGALWFFLVEGRGKPPEWRRSVTLLGVTLLLLFVAYLRLNAVFFWAQSRYLFPAVAALALLWAVGVGRWAPARYRPHLIWTANGVLFFLTLYAGYVNLGGYFEAAAPGSGG